MGSLQTSERITRMPENMTDQELKDYLINLQKLQVRCTVEIAARLLAEVTECSIEVARRLIITAIPK